MAVEESPAKEGVGPNRTPLAIFWKHDGGERYEKARIDRVFNAWRPPRYPAAVVEARNTEDGELQGSHNLRDSDG